jgi:hypothetical protein
MPLWQVISDAQQCLRSMMSQPSALACSPCSLPMGMLRDMSQASTSAAVSPLTSLPNTSASLPRRGCCGGGGSDVLASPLLLLLPPTPLGVAAAAATSAAVAGCGASRAATCGAASSSDTLR